MRVEKKYSSGTDEYRTSTPVATAVKFGHNKGFASKKKLEEHFSKHGSQVGATSVENYLQMAQALRDAPIGPDVLQEKRPSDSNYCRFQKSTGYFMVFEEDGTIRTFFRPNDGLRYYQRQMQR